MFCIRVSLNFWSCHGSYLLYDILLKGIVRVSCSGSYVWWWLICLDYLWLFGLMFMSRGFSFVFSFPSYSRSTDQMCREDSHLHLSAEEEIAADESLSVYCKPVELYNILQRRAVRNVIFLLLIELAFYFSWLLSSRDNVIWHWAQLILCAFFEPSYFCFHWKRFYFFFNIYICWIFLHIVCGSF